MAGLKLVVGVVCSLMVIVSSEKKNRVITNPKYPGFKSEVTYEPENCIYRAQTGDTMYQDYIGRLTNGIEFDQSYKRGHTFNFKLNTGAVIKGMDLGMDGMCKGEKRTVTIPPEIGYGAKGIKNLIPGGSTLIFEVILTNLETNKMQTEIIKPVNCTQNAHTNDTLTVKSSGWTLNGKQFEKDVVKTFALGQKIEIVGIEQGLKGMCEGEIRKFVIPGEQAFRKKGREGVGAWDTVIYRKELLKLERPE